MLHLQRAGVQFSPNELNWLIMSTGDDVYFAVQLDTNMNIASGQILPFRTIKSNVGNGYDINTFKFKPPYNGTYEFMLQIMAWHSSSSKEEITANGLDQCIAHTGPGMNV